MLVKCIDKSRRSFTGVADEYLKVNEIYTVEYEKEGFYKLNGIKYLFEKDRFEIINMEYKIVLETLLFKVIERSTNEIIDKHRVRNDILNSKDFYTYKNLNFKVKRTTDVNNTITWIELVRTNDIKKLYKFLYECGSYQKIYQSFNKKELEKKRKSFEYKFKNENGCRLGKIESFEVDIEEGVWTA
ncbi:hypothetical protein [Cetobacterium somerae]